MGWLPFRLREVHQRTACWIEVPEQGRPWGRCGGRGGGSLCLCPWEVRNKIELLLSVTHVPRVTVLKALTTGYHSIFPSPVREAL